MTLARIAVAGIALADDLLLVLLTGDFVVYDRLVHEIVPKTRRRVNKVDKL